MANRLTEISDWNVLLLEAGGDETMSTDIPAVVQNLQLTKIDWQYKTIPQSGACLAFINNQYAATLLYNKIYISKAYSKASTKIKPGISTFLVRKLK
jgi:GMC oxidoreductase